MNDSGVIRVAKNASALAQDREHSAVVATNVRFKLGDAAVVSDAAKVLNQQWSDAGALIFVEHCQCYFGMRGNVFTDVSADADETLSSVL